MLGENEKNDALEAEDKYKTAVESANDYIDNFDILETITNVGKDKAAPLFSVKEFGNDCIMYSMDKILEYGDAINIIQADERNRISERKDVPLFD